jgi:hypothetical protein
MTGPDLGELFDESMPAGQRERVGRVHAMLLEAGPPPELPPSVAPVPAVAEQRLFPRRRRFALLALAAALGAVLFGAGVLVGNQRSDVEAARILSLAGTGAVPGAQGSLAMFASDAAGNLEIELTIRGLPELPAGDTYELWLTKNGEPVARSGSFVVEEGETAVVHLNSPWKPLAEQQWAIMRAGSDEPLLRSSA